MPKMQIQEILKGFVVDRNNIQSVGNMTVIPITSDKEFTNVATANEVRLSRDPDYGQLEFKNSSGQIGITLQGWAMIDDKQQAQDRTTPYAHFIKAGGTKVIPANCIQARQPGHFDPNKTDHDSFMILPPSLRSLALKSNTAKGGQFNAMWEHLAKWSGVDCYQGGLTLFYSKFEDKLDLFVAQFEPVEKQLGAIVLINDQVVAIDLMPRYDSWKYVWRALIRDSYGAESVRQAEKSNATLTRPKLEGKKFKNVEDLASYYEQQKNGFYDALQVKINQAVALEIDYSKQEDIDELTMLNFTGSQFTGQGVVHGDNRFVYLSLVSSSSERKPRETFKSLRTDPYGTSGFTFRA